MLDAGATAPGPEPVPPPGDRPRGARRIDPAWQDALLAARILACAPVALGGIHVTARAAPVREIWLDFARRSFTDDTPVRRMTPSVSAGRLLGGTDIAATLANGRPMREAGLLEALDNGLLIIAMAERIAPDLAGIIAGAMDDHTIGGHSARFGVIALDESDGHDDDHRVPGAIADRLALRIRLDGIALRDAVIPNFERHAPDAPAIDTVEIAPPLIDAIVQATALLRGGSMRAPIQAMLAVRACAALDGRATANEEDVATALRLTCGAMLQMPEQPDQAGQEPDAAQDEAPPPDAQDNDRDDDGDTETPDFDPEMLDDILVAAAQAAKLDLDAFGGRSPARLRADGAAGKSGIQRKGTQRGRPAGLVARPPFAGARPNVTATLRTAAPWQSIRRKARGLPGWSPGEPLDVRPADFRYTRYVHNTESTAIFAVDASGSTALERLGEAKGCVELLLADCYVRRDQVALVAFRGDGAEVLLEPTRSLVRAKRSLTALPGGGPTPLADGMRTALDMAERVRRRGQSPLIVLLTDGKGNVALDGARDRASARADAEEIAKTGAALGVRTVIIDIARRPRDAARTLAETMQADYVTLPRADAAAMSDIVSDYLKAG